MTASERLCALLDEQRIEWREHEAPATDCIAFCDGNGWHDCWGSVDGEVNVTFSMTPEQAIAATLGRGRARTLGTTASSVPNADGRRMNRIMHSAAFGPTTVPTVDGASWRRWTHEHD